MKITAIAVSNFKRLNEIQFSPDGDRALLLIGGKNGQGKSSTLDALIAAFGGKAAAPTDPVRHGADQATIEVETDIGVTIRRTFDADGSSKLTVDTKDGRIASPQKTLDRVIGARFLDPLAWLALSPKDQRTALLDLMGKSAELAQINESRDAAYAERTEVNRDLKRLTGELEAMPAPAPTDSVNTDEIFAEARQAKAVIDSFGKGNASVEALEARIANADTTIKTGEEELAKQAALLEKMKAKRAELKNERAALVEALDKQLENFQLAQQVEAETAVKVKAAEETNRRAFAAAAVEQRRTAATAQAAQLAERVTKLEALMAKCEAKKATLLASNTLGIAGLDPDKLELNGVPLAQASTAEQYRLAIAIAMKSGSELQDIMVRDGALLDDDSRQLLADAATAAGCRIWLEVVGPAQDGIVIHDGRIVGGAA